MKNIYIFVDFDDTLCIHPQPIETSTHMFEYPVVACKNFYSTSKVNNELIDYLKLEKEEGKHIILLTACNSKMLEIKKAWCKDNCSDLFDDYISSSVDLSKSKIIKAFSEYHDIDIHDMLLIDDNSKEIEEAKNLKIQVMKI